MKHYCGNAFTFVSSLLLLFLSCSVHVAGPSTEEGNPAYTCVVTDADGSSIQGAEVIIYDTPFKNSDTSRPVPAHVVAHGYTDAGGSFTIDTIPAGTYTVEGLDSSNGYGAVLPLQITGGIREEDTDTLVLKAGSSIKGVVTRGGVPGMMNNVNKYDAFIDVMIAQTGRLFVTGPDGSFEFTNVPQGAYTLLFYADDGFFTKRVDSIVTAAGVTTVIDTIRLQRFPWINPPKPSGFSAEYDTAQLTVRLWWNPVLLPDIRGYEVVRYNAQWQEDKVYTTTDTTVTDTVKTYASGSVVSYVVRSVNFIFARSYNEGPIDITIR